MSEKSLDPWRRLLQQAVPPFEPAALERDLWPRVLRRLDERHATVTRLDWVLAVALLALLLVFPGVIPGLLYHL